MSFNTGWPHIDPPLWMRNALALHSMTATYDGRDGESPAYTIQCVKCSKRIYGLVYPPSDDRVPMVWTDAHYLESMRMHADKHKCESMERYP